MKTSVDISNSSGAAHNAARTQPVVNVSTVSTGDNKDKQVSSSTNEKESKKPVNSKELTQKTEAMNQFFEAMDASIRFTIHQKTNELMVQVVDQSNNKVLKEFPSREFLDTMAAIRGYVGMLLDKKI